jgi:hypothetical protein
MRQPKDIRYTKAYREERRAIPALKRTRKPTFLPEYYVARSYSSYNYFASEEEARAFASERRAQPWDIGKVVDNGPVRRIEYIEIEVKVDSSSVSDFMKELGIK